MYCFLAIYAFVLSSYRKVTESLISKSPIRFKFLKFYISLPLKPANHFEFSLDKWLSSCERKSPRIISGTLAPYLLLVLSVDSQSIQGKLDQTYKLVQFYCFREKVEVRYGGRRVGNEEEEKRGEGAEGRRERKVQRDKLNDFTESKEHVATLRLGFFNLQAEHHSDEGFTCKHPSHTIHCLLSSLFTIYSLYSLFTIYKCVTLHKF